MDVSFHVDQSIDSVIEALILLAPALFANPTPVIVKGSKPIDMGARMPDGRRVLGDGKTIEGFLAGLVAGSLAGLLVFLVTGNYHMVTHAPAIALGALLGDIAGSFLKRRIGIERGRPAPVLDQLDFYAGALAVSIALGYKWDLEITLLTAIIVGGLHIGANVFAYLAGLKKVPW